MERKIKVNARTLAGVLPFISQEPTRFYLTGVQIEPAPQGGVYCIATDGHALAVTYDSAGHCEGRTEQDRAKGWICPIKGEVLYRLTKERVDDHWLAYFENQCCYLTQAETARPDVPGSEHVAMVYAPAIDGVFPQWRQILPTVMKLDAGVNVDARLIVRFEKAVRVLMGDQTPWIRMLPSSDKGPLVVLGANVHNFFGLVMPMYDPSFPSCSWLDGFDLMAAIEAGKAAGENVPVPQPAAPAAGANAQSAGEDPQQAPAA